MNERQKILETVEAKKGVYQQIALDIFNRPEVSNYEFFACETLSTRLAKEGFSVRTDVAGHRTGFVAAYKSAKPGPVLVFLAEYDALAGLGHGCGHNLFGATSALAATALKQVINETGGEVRVYGTPGEEGGENGSAKGSFVREGFLRDVDAALCVHPCSGPDKLTASSLVCAPIDIEFWGRAAHASGNPEDGVNALDALILTYNGINALRQHLKKDIQIHGIIVNGGDAPNTVPDYAKAKFYLRSRTVPQMEELWPKIERIVEGAALMTGAKGRMQPYQNRVENTLPTPSFDEIYRQEMEKLGVEVAAPDARDGLGSTDCGNISQVVPTMRWKSEIELKSVSDEIEITLRTFCSEEDLVKQVEIDTKRYQEMYTKYGKSEKREEYYLWQNANLKMLGSEDQLGYVRLMNRGVKIELLEDEAPAEYQLFKIGDVCVIGCPGEIFVEYGLYMKAMAGFGTVIVNELTNGCLPGYLYTPESLVTGGYETDTSMLDNTFGRHMMDTVLELAQKL